MQHTYAIDKRGEHEWVVSANGYDLLRFERKTTAFRTVTQAELLCKNRAPLPFKGIPTRSLRVGDVVGHPLNGAH
jgi:hypothetical protein